MTAGIGHNSGRVDEPGRAFRKFAWGKARAQLLPKLPIEVVRRRVLRAKELGLPYKTYAGLRASSGDDLIGFLFSSNALGVRKAGQGVDPSRADKVITLRDARTFGLAHAPITPEAMCPPLQAAAKAPRALAPWSETRDVLQQAFAAQKLPSSRTVLICETELELEWLSAARMAGAIRADQFFAASP